MTATPTWSATDDATADLLDLIEADWRPFAEADRNTVARIIRDDADAHGGEVHPNRVRFALAQLPVLEQPKPQRVGPVYRAPSGRRARGHHRKPEARPHHDRGPGFTNNRRVRHVSSEAASPGHSAARERGPARSV